MKFAWTTEREELLFALVTDGRHSFTEIGRLLGCNKNQAIGKWHRIANRRGIVLTKPRPKNHASQPPKARPKPVIVIAKNTGPVMRPVKPAAPVAKFGRVCGILEVTGCRWPVSSDDARKDEHRFCNAAQHKGSSYCEAHAHEATASYSQSLIRRTTRSVIAILKKAQAA